MRTRYNPSQDPKSQEAGSSFNTVDHACRLEEPKPAFPGSQAEYRNNKTSAGPEKKLVLRKKSLPRPKL